LARVVQELVLDPVQGPAGVGAGIDIGGQHRAAAHDEQSPAVDLETAAAGIGDLGETAERPARREAHPFIPPMAAIIFHCAAETGTTERRPWRTSAKSASRLSALMAASVTGFATGSTAARSTMPKRPLPSEGSG